MRVSRDENGCIEYFGKWADDDSGYLIYNRDGKIVDYYKLTEEVVPFEDYDRENDSDFEDDFECGYLDSGVAGSVSEPDTVKESQNA